MSKKSRKRNKKILAALALAGGAAMLAKGRGKGTGAVSTAGQPVGVDRTMPPSKYIQKKVVPDVVPAAETITSNVPERGRLTVGGKGPNQIRLEREAMPGYGVEGPPSILNPYRHGAISGRAQRKGGGIAKRGMGAAFKSGGRVKSMGIAKRGGGAAKR